MTRLSASPFRRRLSSANELSSGGTVLCLFHRSRYEVIGSEGTIRMFVSFGEARVVSSLARQKLPDRSQ